MTLFDQMAGLGLWSPLLNLTKLITNIKSTTNLYKIWNIINDSEIETYYKNELLHDTFILIYSSLFHQQTTLGPPVPHNPSMPTRPKTRHLKQPMFFCGVIWPKGRSIFKSAKYWPGWCVCSESGGNRSSSFPSSAVYRHNCRRVLCKKYFWDQQT